LSESKAFEYAKDITVAALQSPGKHLNGIHSDKYTMDFFEAIYKRLREIELQELKTD